LDHLHLALCLWVLLLWRGLDALLLLLLSAGWLGLLALPTLHLPSGSYIL